MRIPLSLALLFLAGAAAAADHRDAPLATADPTADINDIYAFMNPNNPDELILVSTVVPFANYNSRFSDAVEYRFYIDNGAAQMQINCHFVDQSNAVECTGPNGLSANGGIERTVQGSGMRVWAGLRDDPFFFDGPAFNRTRATLAPAFTNPGVNSFTGNTLALVLAVERSRLDNSGANPVLKVWGATNRFGDTGISPGISGLWFDASKPGYGAHIEVLDPAGSGGPDRVAVTWYVYNTFGEQRWIVGEGTIDGDTANIPTAIYTDGGLFPPNFNPSQVQTKTFGSLSFQFSDCNSAVLTYTSSSAEFGSMQGQIALSRLTQIKDQPCTFYSAGQVDRMGRPGINTVLINVLPGTGTALKDAYNRASDPATWAPLFQSEIQSNLAALDTLDGITGNALLPAATLASVLVDDRLLIDTSKANCDAYLAVELGLPSCGGRTLSRDIIDDSLGAIVGPGVSDNVANDSVFLSDFPYLGRPL
jgi:hypothetical protein